MNDVVYKTLKEKDFIMKNYLIRAATELKLSLNETLLTMYFMNQDEPTLNIPNITATIHISEEEIMEAFTKLTALNLISINVIKNTNGVRTEIISCDNILKQVTTDITNNHKEAKKEDLFTKIENELGHLSSIEYQIIDDWLNQGFSEDIIEEALKEAVYNNTKSLRYINKILITWKAKGVTSRNDLLRNSRKDREDSLLIDLVDSNWLDED